MYQVGEKVVYGTHGACEIVSVEKQKVTMQIAEYYVLKPLDKTDSRFLVPTQNKLALSKLQPMLSKSELESLLDRVSKEETLWIPEDNQRRQKYKELMSTFDRASLIGMVHTLNKQKAEYTSAGKKFHLCDEAFLKDVSKLLSSEFSIVLGIPPEDVMQYIYDKLDNRK